MVDLVMSNTQAKTIKASKYYAAKSNPETTWVKQQTNFFYHGKISRVLINIGPYFLFPTVFVYARKHNVHSMSKRHHSHTKLHSVRNHLGCDEVSVLQTSLLEDRFQTPRKELDNAS